MRKTSCHRRLVFVPTAKVQSMQRRIKTYGKRSTRIITVTNTTVSKPTTIQSTQSTSTHDHVSDSSNSSAEEPPSPLPPKEIATSSTKTRKSPSDSKKQPAATRVNMDDTTSRAKHKTTRSREETKTENTKAQREGSRTQSASTKQSSAACLTINDVQEGKTASSAKAKQNKIPIKPVYSFDSSKSEDKLESRAGPRPRPKKYIVTDSEESSLSVSDNIGDAHGVPTPSEDDSSDSSLSSPIQTTYHGQRNGKNLAKRSSERSESTSSSSRMALPKARNQTASPLSSEPEARNHNSQRNGPQNVYMGTPQLKASHLRQARYRRPTPFKRIPRISLASTITTPGLSILPAPFQTSTPAKRCNIIISDESSSDDEDLLRSSSPLTWEHTITPEAARMQSLPPESAVSDSDSNSASSETASRTALATLFALSEQNSPIKFTEFLETFKLHDLETLISHGPRSKARTAQRNSLKYRKIGDASYSEVFGIGDVVIKIIPLALEVDGSDDETEQSNGEEVPFKSSLESVLKEIVITKTVGDVHDGFIKLLRTYVVSGKYPKVLIKEWDEFKRERGSDGTRPDSFNEHQLYAVIVLPHAGVDLETYTFTKTLGSSKQSTVWRDAAEIFWQVASSLAWAEGQLRFEHRDLHWGQIVVRKVSKLEGSDPVINATIIDLALSRVDNDGIVHFSTFEEELFTGRGVVSHQADDLDEGLEPDYQFDVYRMMKLHNNNDWTPFHPLSNVMWLHYLSLKLLKHKGLRKPNSSTRQSTFNKKALSSSMEGSHLESEWQAYQHLANIEHYLELRLKDIVAGLTDANGGSNRHKSSAKGKAPAAGGKGNTSTSHSSAADSLNSAADVVLFWLSKEW